jgi:phosphatidylserine decarboxylase
MRRTQMKYRDREGRDVGVETGQDQFLKHLYGNAFGRAVIRIMIRPWVSRLGDMFWTVSYPR